MSERELTDSELLEACSIPADVLQWPGWKKVREKMKRKEILPDRADSLFLMSGISYTNVIFLLRIAETLFRSNRERSWMFDCRSAVIAVAKALAIVDTLNLSILGKKESYPIPYERLVTAILGLWRLFLSKCNRESVESLLLSADNNGLIVINKHGDEISTMSDVAVQPSGDQDVLKEAKRLGITIQMVSANRGKPSGGNGVVEAEAGGEGEAPENPSSETVSQEMVKGTRDRISNPDRPKTLGERYNRALGYVKSYWLQKGEFPSYSEIAHKLTYPNYREIAGTPNEPTLFRKVIETIREKLVKANHTKERISSALNIFVFNEDGKLPAEQWDALAGLGERTPTGIPCDPQEMSQLTEDDGE